MGSFFASIYEWFGLIRFYETDLADWLRGWDELCEGYNEQNKYVMIGFFMIISSLIVYVVLYHVIDSSRFKSKGHWWISLLILVLSNFFFAFSIPYNVLMSGNFCEDLSFDVFDCIGFGISNSIWTIIFYILITSFKYPKAFSINCKYTTFWRP